MKIGVLFSGGKDSVYAARVIQNEGHELACLISIFSKNPDSFMFHTPAIDLTKKQAECMEIPILIKETEGAKEDELEDLKDVLIEAKEKYGIEGVVSGAIASHYQSKRIDTLCEKIGIKHLTPLWKKDQVALLKELIEDNFDIVISGVAAYPLDESWIGRKIDSNHIANVEKLSEEYGINPAGEGGEFETLVVNCPLFKRKLECELKKVIGEGNSWKGVFVSE